MILDLCIPAFNEEAIILETLSETRKCLNTIPGLQWRIIVANNASTDRTGEKVTDFGDPNVILLPVEKKGKGVAIVEASKISTADYFGYIDADLSVDLDDIPILLEILDRDSVDVVIGSRLLDTKIVHRGLLRTASSRIFNGIRHAVLGINVVDSQCGLKIMNTRATRILRTCEEQGWFLDLELLARCERTGLKIREVPVHWDESVFAGRMSKLNVFADGIGALIAMCRIRSKLL